MSRRCRPEKKCQFCGRRTQAERGVCPACTADPWGDVKPVTSVEDLEARKVEAKACYQCGWPMARDGTRTFDTESADFAYICHVCEPAWYRGVQEHEEDPACPAVDFDGGLPVAPIGAGPSDALLAGVDRARSRGWQAPCL